MKKQLIVVVHGVGVRSAGTCADQLSAVLNDPATPSRAAISGGIAQDWRPHSSDDFHLHEDAAFGEHGLLPTFAAHLRRFRRYVAGKPDKISHERVVADYYWGDISGTGRGGIAVLLGFVKIILGLSHAIRENAMDVFPGMGGRAIWLRRITLIGPLMIHGPIAALNAVLVAGVFVALGLGNAVAAVPVLGLISPEVAIGVLSVLAGWIGLLFARVYLLRHLLSWVVAVGLFILAMAALEVMGQGNWLGRLIGLADGWMISVACEGAANAGTCATGYVGISLLGVRLMSVMMLAWAITLLAAVVVGVASRVPGLAPERGRVSNFLQPAIALMTLLWFLLMAAVWAVVLQLDTTWNEKLIPDARQVEAALRMISPAVLALVALIAVGLWLHFAKGRGLAAMEPAQYLPQRDTLAEQHRLIVGRRILAVLTGFTVVIVLLGVFSLTRVCLIGPERWCDWAAKGLSGETAKVIAGVGVVATLLIGAGRASLAMGIEIFTDVLVYLNDYSWRSREAALGTTEADCNQPLATRTLLERMLGMRKAPDQVRQGYWLRKRIQMRMEALMATLVRNEAPDEIVIVSHSQGTMIAIDVIERAGQGWLDALPKGGVLKLVTMGSPYIHVYNTYFPSQFRAPAARPVLQKVSENGVLSDWVNIFRVDDFVGTHIDTRRDDGAPDQGNGWPREVPVPCNGHTHYWVDPNVFPALREVLEF
jgi:hypothetical protein